VPAVATAPASAATEELFEDAQPILLDMGPMPGTDPLVAGRGERGPAASDEVATLVLPGRTPPPRDADTDAADTRAKEPLFAEDAPEIAMASPPAEAATPMDAAALPSSDDTIPPAAPPRVEVDIAPASASVAVAEVEGEAARANGDEAEGAGHRRVPASAVVFRPADSEAAVPDFAAERRERERAERTWALACIPVAMLLALQLALHWRAELGALAPGLRGLLTVLCAPFRCDVGLPQHPEMLTLEGTNLEADAAGTLTLYSTLRNRARYEQALPAIELTLTDPRDQPVARRLLRPGEYAPARREGIAAGGEVAVKVPIEAAAIKAAGFRAEAVYP
jgi:hypothetical protein